MIEHIRLEDLRDRIKRRVAGTKLLGYYQLSGFHVARKSVYDADDMGDSLPSYC